MPRPIRPAPFEGEGATAMTFRRELRIDFFRGLALMMVLVNHIEIWSGRLVVEPWAMVSLGFSDAAEIFVFLSGFVFAIAYSQVLERDGLAACTRKACWRAFEVYRAYLLVSWLVIAIGALCMRWGPPYYHQYLLIGERPWPSFLATWTLQFHPLGFEILAIYVVILPAMPLLLYLARRAAWLAWTISAGTYLLALILPDLNPTRFGDQLPWFFNPFSWQFLFFLGVWLGIPGRQPAARFPRWLLTLASLFMLALGLFVVKLSPSVLDWEPSLADRLGTLLFIGEQLSVKTILGPLRLLHFFALVHLSVRLLPRDLGFWSSSLARPFVVCGQHSLEVYAFGLLVTFLAVFAITNRPIADATVVAVSLLACIASTGFAYGMRWWKTGAALRSNNRSSSAAAA